MVHFTVFVCGHTQSEIAELFDLKQKRISQILKKLKVSTSDKFNSETAVKETYTTNRHYQHKPTN